MALIAAWVKGGKGYMGGKANDLDDLDRGIILALQKDGKASSRDLARELKVSDGTVRFRISRLRKRGILRLAGSIDPFALDQGLMALVGMGLEKRTHQATMAKIAALPGVVSVGNVTGRYDLLVEVFCESRQVLKKFLVEDLAKVGGITSTETFIYLDAVNKWTELG